MHDIRLKETMRDCRLLPLCSLGLRSSGMLSGVTSQKSEGLKGRSIEVSSTHILCLKYFRTQSKAGCLTSYSLWFTQVPF